MFRSSSLGFGAAFTRCEFYVLEVDTAAGTQCEFLAHSTQRERERERARAQGSLNSAHRRTTPISKGLTNRDNGKTNRHHPHPLSKRSFPTAQQIEPNEPRSDDDSLMFARRDPRGLLAIPSGRGTAAHRARSSVHWSPPSGSFGPGTLRRSCTGHRAPAGAAANAALRVVEVGSYESGSGRGGWRLGWPRL